MTTPPFNAENIIAILDAAPKGGTIGDVIARSQAKVTPTTLQKWIKEGNKAIQNEQITAYRLFTEQWNNLYPGPPPRAEAARMAEIKKALEHLGIKTEEPAVAQIAAPSTRPRRPRNQCECGNSKNPRDTSCASCAKIDSSRASASTNAGAPANGSEG